MVSFNKINNYFNKWNRRVGELSGVLIDVYRPDYTDSDNEPQLIYSGLRYRLDPTGASRFQEPAHINCETYDIFGNRDILQPGDMLIKGDLNDPDTSSPICTITTKQPVKAMVGIRTSRKGHVIRGVNDDGDYDILMENVFFEYINAQDPFGNLTVPYNKDGTSVPQQKVVMYYRPEVYAEGYSAFLVETDYEGNQIGNIIWKINEMTPSGNLLALSLSMDHR